ncbi:FHA domain-containing protein [Dactylosporangium aurantiacum]|uniref:FHA domain-containing protein n=1 Tax=Dactylosporangium aurantiacum TaxID=35754 RepID=A0A9Q9INJ5_9ACTN|nr:FHA domain-containing protein [Dactylosporangium aurantiacum]MDG6106220.1 FHA domain-containing protein [Dactylosporangium aurantiacum]UWZ58278.1 FHA domain-containing protein [Dactylosporangium aurantiacum]
MTVTALLIGTPDGVRRVGPEEQVLRIGRDPLCRIVVEDPRVSREHVEVRFGAGGWRLRDLGSRNGTFAAGARIDELDLARPCQIRLGAVDGPTLTLRLEHTAPPPTVAAEHAALPRTVAAAPAPAASGPRFEAGRVPSATYRAARRTRIGRAPDNDIVLADLQVSRYHAELVRTDGGLRLVDLGTRNGSFVNGRRVGEADLRSGDLLSFGRHQLVVDGAQLREYVDTGRVSLRVQGLGVTVAGGKRLLDRVGFELGECQLLAVVGPSGAGKSTLLGALTGYRPANEGAVVYQGRDLYAEYDDLRQRIGLVPQDDILHAALSVRRALRYAAALRFGADVTAGEREQRIDEVLGQLGLSGHAEQRIDTLSGGQRKRTSVALELLTEPSLLFLDEPTSGLDPSLDRDVMLSLRDLADRGRTVVVVTHSPLHLNVCDRVLVLGRGGKVAYFGPPADLLAFFGADEYADVFKRVYDDPDGWAARYAVMVTPPPVSTGAPAGGDAPAPAEPPPARQGWWRQLTILTRRMAAVTLADRMYAALLLGLPLGLAALLYVIPGGDGFARPDNPLGRSAEAAQLTVVLIIGAVFFGLAGGVRELVRERPVYRRERAVGLAPGAYLGSKVLGFAAVNGVQAALFVLVGLAGRPGAQEALALRWPLLELIAVVWLTALVSTVTGLLVSAYVSTGEQTMPVLVGLVMAQLVLCGGLFAVVGRAGVEQLSWLAPARWGYAAAAATVDLRALAVDPSADALWRHTAAAWWWAVGVLALQGVLVTVAGRWALRRHEPGR